MALRWYVVHAYSNFEHKVRDALEDRVKQLGLEHKFGKILVPTEEVVEVKNARQRKSDRKFFPGYVLVQMEMDEETWHLVREVPKVSDSSVARRTSRRRSPSAKPTPSSSGSRRARRSRSRRCSSSPARWSA